ncbi:hypothetical protein FA798_25630 [Escherichia coli]|nr:hypothetical protein [Escherichia coli]
MDLRFCENDQKKTAAHNSTVPPDNTKPARRYRFPGPRYEPRWGGYGAAENDGQNTFTVLVLQGTGACLLTVQTGRTPGM